MRGSGNSMQAHNPAARQAYEQAVRSLHEVTLDELAQEFSVQDIIEVDRYHRSGQAIGELALNPLPKSLYDSHGEAANILANNTTTYDDDGEDLLVDDDVIRDIMLERNRTNQTELTVLFRVRRSVVAFILSNWNSIEDSQQPKQAG